VTADGRTSEVARQSVHVAVGALALALPWLTWPQAVLLGAAGVLFNLILLPRLLPRLFRPEDRRQPLLSGIVLYPAAVLGLILLFPSRLDLAAIAWVILAASDGMATLVGAHVKTSRLPWNPEKSIGGLAAFVVFGGAAAVATAFWMSGNSPTNTSIVAFAGSTGASTLALVVVPLLATTAAAFVETVPIKLNDNISVPAIAALVLWSCAFMNEVILWQVLALMPSSRFWTAIGLNVVVAVLGYRAGTVTVGGAIAGAVIGAVMYVGTGLNGWLLLFASFLLAAATTRLGLKRKTAAGIAEERGGRRGAGNAIANTGLAALAAFVALGALDDLPVLAMVAALATAASDTVASEVGKAWGRTTWLIVGFRRVPPGTSGAVSLEGTAAGVVAATFLAWLAAAFGLITYEWIVCVVFAATAASLVESWLGATLERDGVLNNDALNFVNSAIGAGLALILVSGSQ
jgi:uncharacterized protein (TIGR00297 family)